MNIVFFDSETTSLNPLFGQIIEFSAIVCDENLRETGEELHLNCRLSPGIIPDAKALLVTSKSVEDINNSSYSHYEMVMKIMTKARQWSPALWIGWNSIGFDFPYLSSSYYKCLMQSYFHQMYDNRRGDALGIARAIHAISPKVLQVPTTENGKHSFRLSGVAEANGINHEDAHSSKSDTLATIEICRQLARRADDLWQECLQTTKKSDAERLLKNAPLFTYAQSGFGSAKITPMTQICYHPAYSYPMGLDISVDPKEYIDLDPKGLLEVLRGKTKFLKAIAPNKHPIILDPNRALELPSHRNLDLEEALDRVKTLRGSTKFKANILKALELETSKKRKGMSKNRDTDRLLEVEEQMTKLPFEDSAKDCYLKEHFEECGSWETRVEIIEDFEDHRYKILGLRILYENKRELLSNKLREIVENDISRKLESKVDVPWNTYYKTKNDILNLMDNNRGGLEGSLSSKEIKILDSLDRYISNVGCGR